MNVSELNAKYSEIILSNIGRQTFTQSEIDEYIALYEMALAMVPKNLMDFVNPRMTGTIETEREYQTTHWTMVDAEPSFIEYRVYTNVGSRIVSMLNGTLGLRD